LNDYLLSLLLGIIEGLTEFLPVSSTAHLRISEAMLHISLSNGYWKMYTIVIQLGAILCLPVYFRARISKFLSTFPRGERGDRTVFTHPLSLTLIAFVVTAIPAFLLTKVIGKHLESLHIMGTSLLVGGIVMWIVDAMNAKSKRPAPTPAQPHSHLEDGSHEPRPGDLDWGVSDFVRCFFREHHDQCPRLLPDTRRYVTGFGAGIFLFSLHAHDGRCNLLRSSEIAAR